VTDRRQRVLVVDDAANLRELLSIVLDLEDDFTVVAAVATTREALDRAEALRPDVVLLEIAVPARDGVDAVVELRRLRDRDRDEDSGRGRG
jgi:DNA-binding NarL/FixJ family response regulator